MAPRGRAGPRLRSHALVFFAHHAQYFGAHDDLAFYEAAGEELFLCHGRLVAEQLSQHLPRNDRLIDIGYIARDVLIRQSTDKGTQVSD